MKTRLECAVREAVDAIRKGSASGQFVDLLYLVNFLERALEENSSTEDPTSGNPTPRNWGDYRRPGNGSSVHLCSSTYQEGKNQ